MDYNAAIKIKLQRAVKNHRRALKKKHLKTKWFKAACELIENSVRLPKLEVGEGIRPTRVGTKIRAGKKLLQKWKQLLKFQYWLQAGHKSGSTQIQKEKVL